VIRQLPPQARVRLLFQDEARFGCISDERRCWAPWPLRPIVGHQIIREFVYGLAAVSPFDGELSSRVLPWVDSETMSLFLAHTAARFPNDHCLMLLDGAGWHTAAALQVPPPPFICCPSRPTAPNSTRSNTSGITCARTTSPTESSPRWTQSWISSPPAFIPCTNTPRSSAR